MQLAEKHLLEQMAISLEQNAESARRRSAGIMNEGWSPKTSRVLKKAAVILRKYQEENQRA